MLQHCHNIFNFLASLNYLLGDRSIS